jgi:hypothetical protein
MTTALGCALVVELILSAPPDFCGAYRPSSSDMNISRIDKTSAAFSVEEVGKALCDKPTDEARQAQFAGWTKDIAREWALPDELARTAVTRRVGERVMAKAVEAFCTANQLKKDDAVNDPMRAAWSCLVGCSSGSERDMSFYADGRVELDVVLAAGKLACAVPFPLGADKARGASAEIDPMRYEERVSGPMNAGIALLDLPLMDEKKFFAAVDALKAEPAIDQLLRENFFATKSWHERLKAFYLAKKNPAFKAIVFDAPAAGFKKWQDSLADGPVPFETLTAAERAIIDGAGAEKTCADTLRPGLAKLVKKADGPDKQDLVRSIGRQNPRFMQALVRCEEEAGHELAGSTMRDLIVEPVGAAWGPRLSAYGEVALAARKALESPKNPFQDRFDERFSGSFGKAELRGMNVLLDRGANAPRTDSNEGPIATLTPKGEFVEVTFSKVTWKEPVSECDFIKPLRVERFNLSTGEFDYARSCKAAGFETKTAQAKPIKVRKAYAGALKKGQWLTFWFTPEGEGLPVVGYADQKKTKAVTLFGFAR